MTTPAARLIAARTYPLRTPWLRFPLVAFLLALLVVLILGDHGPEWLLAAMDDEERDSA